MDTKGKKRIVIWVSIAALLGVGGYFAYKFVKAKRDKKKAEEEALKNAASTTSTNASTSSGSSAPKPTLISNPFLSSDELRKFQNWVLTMYPFDRAILGSTGADGKWGNNSANAWTKYGQAYLARPTQGNILGNFGWNPNK
jgi:hypothetical protein